MVRCSNPPADRPASSTADDLAIRTALVADDSPAIREMLRLWLLADEGWDVREASNGEQALAQLDDTVDVLILDREMPECTGPEVVDRLDDTAFRGYVIVVSGCPPDSRLGVDDVAGYVTKPLTRDEFLDVLDRTRR